MGFAVEEVPEAFPGFIGGVHPTPRRLPAPPTRLSLRGPGFSAGIPVGVRRGILPGLGGWVLE